MLFYLNTMNFKSYNFADLKALKNELILRLNDPLQAVKFDEYREMVIHTNKEIDSRLDRLISPQKQKTVISFTRIDFMSMISLFNRITGSRVRILDADTKKKIAQRYEDGHTIEDYQKALKTAFDDMSERGTVKHLTLEFISRPKEFTKYLNMIQPVEKSAYVQA